jgi:hypothetical protein
MLYLSAPVLVTVWWLALNLLKTKCIFYIRTQCVPRCKHSPLRL